MVRYWCWDSIVWCYFIWKRKKEYEEANGIPKVAGYFLDYQNCRWSCLLLLRSLTKLDNSTL